MAHWRPHLLRSAGIAVWAAMTGCQNIGATVDLGDNLVAPELRLDEGTFFCIIQPAVIAAQGCARGGMGEAGSCHANRSSLRLSAQAEVDPAPTCDGNTPVGTVPDSYLDNLEAIRFTVNSDPLSSPLYRRPTGLSAHPRSIFSESSTEAMLIAEWIAAGAM